MKQNSIQTWTKYSLALCGVSGMLLLTACGDSERRNADEAEYGMGSNPDATGGGIEGADSYERTSNTAVQRNYDVSSMGTAAANRRQMQASGANLSDQDYQRVRQDYDNLNQQMRESYRQSPGMSMRYTDDYRTPDYSYQYYGVYYDGINDAQTRARFTEMEQRRTDLKNQMRGKKDPKTGAYLAAEMDAVPKEGYDQFYNQLQSKLSSTQQQGAAQQGSQAAGMNDLSGTVFVEFVVDKNGNVTNPKVVESIVGQGTAGNMAHPAGTAGTTGTTGTAGSTPDRTPTQTTTGQGQTGTTGTTGTSGNTAGTAGAGTTGNTQASTASTKQLEQKVIEAVKSTSGMWEPAQMNGQPVASLVQMPIPVGNNSMQSGAGMNQQHMNQGGANQGGTHNNNTGINSNDASKNQINTGGINTNNGGVSTGTNNSGTTGSGAGTNTGTGTTGGTNNTGDGGN